MVRPRHGVPPEPARDGPPGRDRWVGRGIWAAGLAVAIAAAAATAHGLYEVVRAAGGPVVIAGLYPLITDGLALVAYAATTRLTGPGRRYAWAIVILPAGLSGLAQATYLAGAVHTAPGWLRAGVGGWPAIAAAIVAHLLYLLGTRQGVENTARRIGPLPADGDQAPERAGTGDGPGVPTRPVPPGPPVPEVDQPDQGPDRMERTEVPRHREWNGSEQPSVQPGQEPDAVEQHPVPDVQPYDGNGPPEPVGRVGVPTAVPDQHRNGMGQSRIPASEHPFHGDGPPFHPGVDYTATSARDRARRAASDHASERDELPTVSELAGLAGVGRGTAARALKQLRTERRSLQIVPSEQQNGSQP